MIAADARSPAGRHLALYGAWLAGAALGATTMGLHHKLCHTLGGTLGLPHAETHTVVLPHVLAFTLPVLDPPVRTALTEAFGVPADGDPARRLRELTDRLGAPDSLAALGADRDALPGVAAQVVASPYGHPREAGRDDVAALLDRAWTGAPPRP